MFYFEPHEIMAAEIEGSQMILVTKCSDLTGRSHTIKIPMESKEFTRAERSWKNGKLIQDAFPTLSRDQREFIKTGITPKEWNEFLGSWDEENEKF